MGNLLGTAGPVSVRSRTKQGIWVLVISLTIFFSASMLLYVFYIGVRLGSRATGQEMFSIPRTFWLSTALLVAVSALLHGAVAAVRRDRFFDVSLRTTLAFAAAVLFLVVQTGAMSRIVTETQMMNHTSTSPYPYTLILALLHALHVVAGVIYLAVVVVRSLLKHYDHEQYTGIEVCAIYWHFLDLVWLFMLASFYAASAIYSIQTP